MATMATDMLLKNKFVYAAMLFVACITSASAGDLTLTPSVQVNETYTDNINVESSDKTGSFVTESSATIQGGYESQKANLQFISTHSYYSYSHDSDLNDNARTLEASGDLKLTNRLSVNSSASIDNINENNADNSLDNLIIDKTVEQRSYDVGAQYNIENSSFLFNSSINYQITEVDDNIGESEGYTANYSTENGSNARNVFWSSNGIYNDRENDGDTGQNYNYEVKIGWISPYKLTPFIRYFDEDSSGNISSGDNTKTSSWGPGLRWKIAKHLFLDTSYNYVSDNSESDDYVDAQLSWQPSSRTNLNASYSERFYGKAYNVDFTHRNRRLSNTIRYKEDLEAFTRDNYELNDSGDLELVEDNEFNLTKVLSWQSTLRLSRTTFDLSLSHRDSESLETNRSDETLSSQLSATRRLSRKSSLTFTFNYERDAFNEDSTEGDEQVDYYRTYSTGYNLQLLHSLSTNFNIEYVNRDSSTDALSYDEMRGVFNISKEF